MAVLAVFHDLNLAAAYCDEIALMAAGRIVAHGPPAAVITPAWIADVYGVDVAVAPHPRSGRPIVLPPAAMPEPAAASVLRNPSLELCRRAERAAMAEAKTR